MPSPYLVLGVPLNADDEVIRRRYLELTREYQPELHPERFAAIRAAYEKLKDIEARARYLLFHQGCEESIDELLEEMACQTPRSRIGLTRLLSIVPSPGR